MKNFTRFAVCVFAFALLASPAWAVDITVSPTELTFKAPVGYGYGTVAGQDIEVTVANGGSGDFFNVVLDNTKFTADVMGFDDTNFTHFITIKPVDGLAEGTYTDTLKFENTADPTAEYPTVALKFVVGAGAYSATIVPTSARWLGNQGYNNYYMTVVFTITSIGTETITNLTATLASGATDTVFEIISPLSPNSIARNETATVSVRPKIGYELSHTPYTDSMIITGDDGIELTVPLAFSLHPVEPRDVAEEAAKGCPWSGDGGCGSITGMGMLLALVFGLWPRRRK